MYDSSSALGESMKQVFFCVLLALASCSFSLGQTYKVLWSFGGAPNDGALPAGNLIFDGKGNLYGTTRNGGSSAGAAYCYPVGCGTVFELSPDSDGTWTETVLYNFCTLQNCTDGLFPVAGLLIDASGDLYGTTQGGGASSCIAGSYNCGTVFELSPPASLGEPWTETVLYSFCSVQNQIGCADGNTPSSQLTADASGNLYGTTSFEGAGTYPGNGGGGNVFELSPTPSGWIMNTLYNFCSTGQGKFCPDGSYPVAGVTFDGSGNLYGTTEKGGGGIGEVYELSPGASGWTLSIVYTSHFGKQGIEPQGTVSIVNGTLYTTFSSGGNNGFAAGGVWRLNPTQRRFSSLPLNYHNGANPAAGVIVNSANTALFGTSSEGGTAGAGAIFEVSSPSYTVLYNFCSQPGCTDGEYPVAGLVEDQAGNFYGTAELGGICDGIYCNGVVFEITP